MRKKRGDHGRREGNSLAEANRECGGFHKDRDCGVGEAEIVLDQFLAQAGIIELSVRLIHATSGHTPSINPPFRYRRKSIPVLADS
jgi:hypothetical protein